VTPLIGTIDDADKITAAAYAADVTIEAANCDHLGLAQAIVAGLEKKYHDTNKKPIYIHTSGSGILVDLHDTKFGQLSTVVYDDTNEEQIASIPLNNPHRNVDDYIIKHSGSYNLVIVAPTLVYGKGLGPEGIANPHSIQIPGAIRAAIKNGYAFQVGEGKNIWGNVHIADLVDLYDILLEGLLANKITTLGAHGYFFVENGENVWADINQEIARIGYNKGVLTTQEVKSGITDEEVTQALGAPEQKFFIGSNSRCKATKARNLGWKPKHQGEVFEYIETLFTALLKERQ